MRIFLAGGSGVIGRGLIPRLVEAGHDVTATTRESDRTETIAALGGTPAILDVFEAEAVNRTVAAAKPDVILHMFTDLSGLDFDANARIRREGTRNLVSAASAAGVDRLILQSIAWAFPDGEGVATEDIPIAPGTPVDAMEQIAKELPHVTILRFGTLYGPGTWYSRDGHFGRAVSAGALPASPAITSFVHIDDALTAIVQSLSWPDGTYLITDDESAPATVWMPVFAGAIDAPEPPVAPLNPEKPAGRIISNAKARAAGWTPRHATWREGFTQL
ncbi:NAD-dependent epimerase/dehydratase family protein [Microbacterium yannicii]|uniref:NAD-dependent epimerase/dehydratase family protein n=1 Tax=Microbacterium yannicii TaxID=671622 RepID=UPI00037B491E|nr:NAD(P)-dependent oxidoreductase [Microbacterium yannicii]